MFDRHEILRLMVAAGGGYGVVTKVGEAIIGWPGEAHLLGAIGGVGGAGRGVELLGGGSRPEGGQPAVHVGRGVDPALDPDLLDSLAKPAGEQADAVAARHDRLEIRFECRHGQVQPETLLDVEGWLHIERQAGDDAKGAEIDHGAGKGVGVFVA